MTNEKAVEMWRKYPNSKRIRNIAFKAIIKNNSGIMNRGWFEANNKLRRLGIMSPNSHKNDYFQFLYEKTMDFMTEKYNPKQTKFLTYYQWIVRSSVTKYCEQASMYKQPTGKLEFTEIVKGEKVTKTVRAILATNIVELNGINEFTGKERLEDIQDKSEKEDDSIKVYANVLLSNMDKKERTIFSQRHGIGDQKPLTLREIGDIHSISRERVRQILNIVRKKVKGNFNKRSGFSETFVTELKENYLTKY